MGVPYGPAIAGGSEPTNAVGIEVLLGGSSGLETGKIGQKTAKIAFETPEERLRNA